VHIELKIELDRLPILGHHRIIPSVAQYVVLFAQMELFAQAAGDYRLWAEYVDTHICLLLQRYAESGNLNRSDLL